MTNGRKRYFHIDENASGEQIYALLDHVESADEDDIDNLMNGSDTEFIAKEKITFKMRPVIDHLHSKFSEVLSNDSEQSINGNMMKFRWIWNEDREKKIWNYAVHKIKTNKMRFQILVLLFEYIWLSVSDGYLLIKETNTRVQSRS